MPGVVSSSPVDWKVRKGAIARSVGGHEDNCTRTSRHLTNFVSCSGVIFQYANNELVELGSSRTPLKTVDVDELVKGGYTVEVLGAFPLPDTLPAASVIGLHNSTMPAK